MEQYDYQAIDPNGSLTNGFVEAQDRDKAATQLQAQGLLLLKLEPSKGDRQGQASGWFTRLAMNNDELSRFTQQLSTLLGAGQPIERALNTLVRQPARPQACALLERIQKRVKEGQALSSALSLEGAQFSALYVSLVRAGEAGGQLAQTLNQLSLYLERTQKVRGEVINALIYPAFLIVGVLGSLILLLTYVIPQFVPIFSGLGVPVPWVTDIIIALSQFLQEHGIYLVVATMMAVIGLNRWLRTPKGRLNWDRRILRWRLMGRLVLFIETARLSHTLGTLLSQGVPLMTSLDITLKVCNNQAIRTTLSRATDKVKNGHRLSLALEAEQVFPDLAIQMIQVGEESGQLDAMLLKVALAYDEDAKRSIDRLLAALVPSLTLVMAALVAMIMLAIMLPLMSLTSNI